MSRCHGARARTLLACARITVASIVATTSPAAVAAFFDLGSVPSPTNATQLIYSPTYNLLVVKNSASAVATVNIVTRAVTTHLANYNFTDMTLSPSGRYVFAADYGGENIGYGTPLNTSYVHRLDLATGAWETKTAYIAGNVQAVSDTQIILKSRDQWVTFTNNAWGPGPAVIPLNTSSGGPPGPGYYAFVFFGDFRYDPGTTRLLHGNSNSSSQEIQAFRIANDDFVQQEGTGVYGSAQGYGGSVALATDRSVFYYGKLQVDALDVTHTLHAFPELIYAATGTIAFGKASYYDAHTGAPLGALPFQTTVYALNAYGTDFWAYDSSTSTLRHFGPQAIIVPAAEIPALSLPAMLSIAGLLALSGLLAVRAQRRRTYG